MDKLYSKQALVIKAVCCFLLAPLYTLLSHLLSVNDGFLYILLSVMPVGCIFTIPYWTSLIKIRKYRVSKIARCVVWDFAVCFMPAVFGVLFSEIIFTIINGKTVADGFVTLIFSVIFIIVSLVFWLLYYVFSYKK